MCISEYVAPSKSCLSVNGSRIKTFVSFCIEFLTFVKIETTWSSEKQYNWRQLRQNTIDIEEYISEHKELPDKWKAK